MPGQPRSGFHFHLELMAACWTLDRYLATQSSFTHCRWGATLQDMALLRSAHLSCHLVPFLVIELPVVSLDYFCFVVYHVLLDMVLCWK